MMDFLFYYVQVLFLTVGVLIIFGLLVYMCKRIFLYFAGHSFGYRVITATSIIGTPIHELGHAVMCILFRHRIVEIKLLQLNSEDNTLGYVRHEYNRKSFYQVLGNLFIGLGPIFSGLAAILLILNFTFSEFTQSLLSAVGEGSSILDTLWIQLDFVYWMYVDGDATLVLKIISLILIFSICLHVSLSDVDCKNSVKGFVYYAIIALAVSGITYFLSVSDIVVDTLTSFSAITVPLFLLVFIFAVTLVLLSVVFASIKKIFIR